MKNMVMRPLVFSVRSTRVRKSEPHDELQPLGVMSRALITRVSSAHIDTHDLQAAPITSKALARPRRIFVMTLACLLRITLIGKSLSGPSMASVLVLVLGEHANSLLALSLDYLWCEGHPACSLEFRGDPLSDWALYHPVVAAIDGQLRGCGLRK